MKAGGKRNSVFLRISVSNRALRYNVAMSENEAAGSVGGAELELTKSIGQVRPSLNSADIQALAEHIAEKMRQQAGQAGPSSSPDVRETPPSGAADMGGETAAVMSAWLGVARWGEQGGAER